MEGKWEGNWQTAISLTVCGAAIALAFSLSACGGSSGKPVTLTIGARATPEEEILAHIYTGALRQGGFKVREPVKLQTENSGTGLEEAKAGHISAYPEHLDAVLEELLSTASENLPKQSQKAYRAAMSALEEEGLTPLPPTPYSHDRRLAMLRKTAEARHLKTISDLKGRSEAMTMSGPTDCHFAADCLAGFERYYHVYFESISYTYTDKEVGERFKVLEDGQFDASIVNNTDGQLARSNRFVLLEDDKHVLPAGNVILVARRKVAEEAGEGFEKAVVAAQKGLTLPVMQHLDAEVELENKDPAKVAAGYLEGVTIPG